MPWGAPQRSSGSQEVRPRVAQYLGGCTEYLKVSSAGSETPGRRHGSAVMHHHVAQLFLASRSIPQRGVPAFQGRIPCAGRNPRCAERTQPPELSQGVQCVYNVHWKFSQINGTGRKALPPNHSNSPTSLTVLSAPGSS